MTFRKSLIAAALALFATPAFAVLVELTIEFDFFPEETAFGMWDTASAPAAADYYADPTLALAGIAYDVGASSPIGFGDGYVLPGDFAGEPDGVPFSFVWDLAAGDYSFIMMDLFGDGICCAVGLGGYSLSVGGSQVADGGQFSLWEVTAFTVNGGAVPVPGVLALLAIGLTGLGAALRRG